MQNSHPWSVLPQRWCHIDLPGYRDCRPTYGDFPRDSLPPIPIELDDDCKWLMVHGTEHIGGLDCYERDLKPDAIIDMARQAGVKLPESLARFMSSPELQKRVRSCTDCYLDPGQRIIETVGSILGHLIHFLSDSQSCVHWYLSVLNDGRAAVVYSEDLYCYRIEDADFPTCRLDQVDLQAQGFACCATSFSEFLYRFWIENEIWFAIAHDKSRRPLTDLERAYVNHYSVS